MPRGNYEVPRTRQATDTTNPRRGPRWPSREFRFTHDRRRSPRLTAAVKLLDTSRMPPTDDGSLLPSQLHTAVVVRVEEQVCEAWSAGVLISARYAPQFPEPRTERVSPGHLVATAKGPDARHVVLWRWYDAVVVGHEDGGKVRLWEPSHGEVVAQSRSSYQQQVPGARAYVSAGLPDADWWVASAVTPPSEPAIVELGAVAALYTDNGLWETALRAAVTWLRSPQALAGPGVEEIQRAGSPITSRTRPHTGGLGERRAVPACTGRFRRVHRARAAHQGKC